MENRCTLLLSSYDNGEDLWNGFFKCLVSEWPEFDLPVVINTEKKTFQYPGLNIRTFAPCKDRDMIWGERLITVLQQIETKYILLFLEDYWLDSRVDDAFFRKTIQWMEKNDDIANFCFYYMPGHNVQDGRFERFELRPKRCQYKLNCQVAIWNREKMISYVKRNEDPWDWEVFGSMRASKYKERFYSLIEGQKKVFSYGDPEIGCLIHRGKWNKEVLQFYTEKYGVSVDPSLRGYENWDEILMERKKEESLSFFDKLFSKDVMKWMKRKLLYLYKSLSARI